jgi:hypothetical protein
MTRNTQYNYKLLRYFKNIYRVDLSYSTVRKEPATHETRHSSAALSGRSRLKRRLSRPLTLLGEAASVYINREEAAV